MKPGDVQRPLDSTPSPVTPTLSAIPSVELLDVDRQDGKATGRCAPGSMLLLHGFGDDKTSLRPIGEALCPKGALAIYPDLRAHGASPAPAWGYSPLDFAADIQRIADSLPRPVHLVGHSYGALVAAVTGVILGPSRIGSVALLDQSFRPCMKHYEADEWAEASFLKWHYDYSHLIDILGFLGVPVLSVIARDSVVVPEDERTRMLSSNGAGTFSCVLAEGSHTSFLRNSAIDLLADFYEMRRR